ncbi:hypothetical protein [Arthrobacter alpinus]|uniref:hypothetical protein n=1 Tax=Arthrobacter alpinus TaxID=656366 RepID=UPI000A8B0033|nr:hypothetical protein [Arthrobacter alpinus]
MSNEQEPPLILHRISDFGDDLSEDNSRFLTIPNFPRSKEDETLSLNDELRAWAKGLHALEAATELLIRSFDGRFAKPGNPWIDKDMDSGNVWVNFEAIPENLGGTSDGERRLLMLAASLSDVGVEINLGDYLPGFDRKILNLVLAAVAHAAGSHEHSDFIADAEGIATFERLPSLHLWPNES